MWAQVQILGMHQYAENHLRVPLLVVLVGPSGLGIFRSGSFALPTGRDHLPLPNLRRWDPVADFGNDHISLLSLRTAATKQPSVSKEFLPLLPAEVITLERPV